MGLLEISLAHDALELPPGSITGMTVGADVATPHPTLILTVRREGQNWAEVST
jgi:hypothetical protein